jgi:molybdate transport system substrate-binding protein
MLKILTFLFGTLSCAASFCAEARPLCVAAAFDLAHCMEELNAAFKNNIPDADVRLVTGSSGNFYARIKNGAPFDVFLSADVYYPNALIEAGLASKASLTSYAIGRIALWSLNPRWDVSKGFGAFIDPGLRKVAIANPAHAPYGSPHRRRFGMPDCGIR